MSTIYIGTSGFSYKHWINVLYPEGMPQKQWFEQYCSVFDTVELNSTFYHLPNVSTFRSWYTRSPANFIITVKGSRFTTHQKKLAEPQESVSRFIDRAKELKDKLGIILYQLPPGFTIDMKKLEAFIACLPSEYRYAIEFRNETWFVPEVYELLQSRNIAFCIYDMPGKTCPLEITNDFIYLRFHGYQQQYGGNYPDDVLNEWADWIKGWQAEGRDVFAYFNNDFEGYAVRNALRLRELV